MTTSIERAPGALLLAEDGEALRSLSAAFRRRGFQVLTAVDGAAGVVALLDHLLGLDVVVADLGLPGRDGASLLQLVRVAGGERELAVVIRGAGLTPHDRGALWRLGADAVVSASDGADEVAAVAEEAASLRAAGASALRPAAPRPPVQPESWPALPVGAVA